MMKCETDSAAPPRAVRVGEEASPIAFTIATLVNDAAQYEAMVASFTAGGFAGADCEYLFIDNTRPVQTEAFAGLNAALSEARGRHVILCHQDVRLIADGRAALEARLGELSHRDPDWALAGNAGGVGTGRLAIRISDPHGVDQAVGELPQRVMSLDENFIVVRRSARLGFSRDLAGFHLYGADLCLAADMLGWRAYVIDFHLNHLSPGRKDAVFFAAADAFRAKWARALRPRLLQTTCTLLRLDGVLTSPGLARLIEWPMARIARRLPGARGFKRQQDRPTHAGTRHGI